MSDKYIYFGNLGKKERQYSIPKFLGLALYPRHNREIQHDALDTIPFGDNCVCKIQSQDVFEHLPYDKLPFVFDEIYRVLTCGGTFRLSLPDYRSPFIKKRCVYDSNGQVIADLKMGGSVIYDAKRKKAKVCLTDDGNAHVWFPVYELVLELIVRSDLRKCSSIEFYQYFKNFKEYVVKDVPENEMFVMRSVPNDMRANGAPVSIIVDFIK